ncbi:MAG TPA: response regulator [Kofleriaceae bacterium]|nr:response regulator [Kofleriaceae bacterium]
MSKTILCADDSVTMQKVAEITFASTEWKYVGAKSADDALRLAKSERPALILADAVMPGKTGYDLCKAVKSDGDLSGVPVLIMCGNSQAYDSARGEQVGADGHIIKPWDTQVLLDKVGEVLQRAGKEGVAALGQGVAAAPAAAAAAKPAAAAAPPAAAAKPVVTPPAAAKAPIPPSSPKAPPAVAPPRSATIMGMPTFAMPPGVTTPGTAPATPQAAAVVAAAGGAAQRNEGAGDSSARAPMIKGRPKRNLRLVPINEVAAQVAKENGLELSSPEMQALIKLSREVVERIVWEIVPDLAETIIKHNLDKLASARR